MLRAVVHGGLVYAGEETLGRYILIWAGVGEYHIHRMCLALLLDIFLDRRSRLLIRPPLIAHTQAIELIHAVSAADHNALLALYIEYIAVNREQDIRENLLVQNATAVPLLFLIGCIVLRSFLAVHVHAR